MKNADCSISKAGAHLNYKVDASFNYRVSLCFISLPAVLQTFWVKFQAKNIVRNAPASTVLTQVLQ